MDGTMETLSPAKLRRFQNHSRTQLVQRTDLLDGHITVTYPEGKKYLGRAPRGSHKSKYSLFPIFPITPNETIGLQWSEQHNKAKTKSLAWGVGHHLNVSSAVLLALTLPLFCSANVVLCVRLLHTRIQKV